MNRRLIVAVSAFAAMAASCAPAHAAGTPADYPLTSMASGITESRHNLGRYSAHIRADNSDGNGGTTEVCVFCHTPHHGSTNAPIWSKGDQTQSIIAGMRPTTYIAYGTTIGGTVIGNGDIGAATLACLSCHDGINTIDVLANAPGKGNNGANNKTPTDFNWSFTEDGNTVVDWMTSVRLNIGTDLGNDHPVSVQYHEDRASLRPSTTVISSLTLALPGVTVNSETDSSTTTVNRWAVMGYINPTASISDLLRGVDNRVECSSCHDPHFSNKSWSEVASTWGGSSDMDGLFLRRVGGNSLSGVCRTCHNK